MGTAGRPPADELAVARARKARHVLSRSRITRAASDYIELHGLEGLTLRGLGASLQVEAMALYRHVPNRQAILADIANDLIPTDVGVTPPHWQNYLSDLAHTVRRVALEHPRLFSLAATYPSARSWLQPPLQSPSAAEAFFGALRSCGLPDHVLVQAYRIFSAFLLGNLLLEAATVNAPPSLQPPTTAPSTMVLVNAHVRASAQRRAFRHLHEFDTNLDETLQAISHAIERR